MSKTEYYKDALTASPDQSRQILARAMEDEDTTEREVDEIISFALEKGLEI